MLILVCCKGYTEGMQGKAIRYVAQWANEHTMYFLSKHSCSAVQMLRCTPESGVNKQQVTQSMISAAP